jgi:C-terminal processing protease CtpA/Prc
MIVDHPKEEAHLKWTVYMLLCVLVVAAGPVDADESEGGLTVQSKIAGLALVWQEANYNFAFFDRSPDLDWDAEFERAIGRVMVTNSDYEYIREIQRFVGLLGEAHTNVEPGKAFRARYGGNPALELEEIERKAVVVNSSVALAGELPVGSVILAVDHVPVDRYLREQVFPYLSSSTPHYLWRQSIRGHSWRSVGLLMGEVDSIVHIQIETPDGDTRNISLPRLARDAEIEWAEPPRRAREVLTFKRLDDDILYFALNTFNDEDVVTQFEAHLDDLAGARAVVLDIRNNGGGSSSRGWAIGRYFSDTALEVSHWRTRTHTAAYKAWGRHSEDPELQAHAAMDAWYEPPEFSFIDPPERNFTVPVAVLVGSSTYSAAEDFLAFMRAVPNCVFVGGPSAGSTGQPLAVKIPGGAWVGITSKRDTMPDGTEFVGIGVMPDIEVTQTLTAFREGRDPVLERAVAHLQERMR